MHNLEGSYRCKNTGYCLKLCPQDLKNKSQIEIKRDFEVYVLALKSFNFDVIDHL